MTKINGFTRKPHFLQIFSYIVFLGKILAFIFMILPLLTISLKVFTYLKFKFIFLLNN